MLKMYNNLAANYGWQFTAFLLVLYMGSGALYKFISVLQLPYYQKLLGLSAVEYQKYGMIATLPWAMKGFIGVLSDTIPIYGYNKSPYIIMSGLFGILGLVCLALFHLSPSIAALFFFIVILQVATGDLLAEGKYTELMMSKKDHSSGLVTWVWAAKTTGILFAALTVGPISDHFSPQHVFWLCIPFAVMMVAPTIKGWLPEIQMNTDENISTQGFLPVGPVQWSLMRKERRLFTLAILVFFASLSLAFVALTTSRQTQVIYTIGSSALLCTLSYYWLPSTMAKIILYFMISEFAYIEINGVVDYFYTAKPECILDAPHFSYTYYSSITQIFGAMAAIAGVLLFQNFLSKTTFRLAFVLTILGRVMAALVDISIMSRWNLRFGIPDHLAFIFGDAIIIDLTLVLMLMPSVLLISKVCPKGVESTVFATLAGFHAFGWSCSKIMGMAMTEAFMVSAESDEHCDFQNLVPLVAVCHIILPVLGIPAIWVLIPPHRMNEEIVMAASDKPIRVASGSRKHVLDCEYRELDDDMDTEVEMIELTSLGSALALDVMSLESDSEDDGGDDRVYHYTFHDLESAVNSAALDPTSLISVLSWHSR